MKCAICNEEFIQHEPSIIYNGEPVHNLCLSRKDMDEQIDEFKKAYPFLPTDTIQLLINEYRHPSEIEYYFSNQFTAISVTDDDEITVQSFNNEDQLEEFILEDGEGDWKIDRIYKNENDQHTEMWYRTTVKIITRDQWENGEEENEG